MPSRHNEVRGHLSHQDAVNIVGPFLSDSSDTWMGLKLLSNYFPATALPDLDQKNTTNRPQKYAKLVKVIVTTFFTKRTENFISTKRTERTCAFRRWTLEIFADL